MPEVWQQRIDYLNTYLKFDKRQKPNAWKSRFGNVDIPMDAILFNGYTGMPKEYADGAGNNDHLPITAPIQFPHIERQNVFVLPSRRAC